MGAVGGDATSEPNGVAGAQSLGRGAASKSGHSATATRRAIVGSDDALRLHVINTKVSSIRYKSDVALWKPICCLKPTDAEI